MAIQIPLWFYGFSSLTYIIAAFVGVLLTFFSYNLYKLTGRREHKFLFYSMAFLTLGFLIVTFSNIFGLFHFQRCFPACQFDMTDPNYSLLIKGGNYAYYITSFFGYIFLAMTYLKTIRLDKIFDKYLVMVPLSIPLLMDTLQHGFLYPFDNFVFQLFHLLSIVIMSYINFNTVTNYLVLKTKNSFPVMIAFLFIGAFHFLMALTPFWPIIFVTAHILLLAGLVSLLWMLIQVNKVG